MLEIRPCCEHCGKDLPYNATDAMICTFECTYCADCANEIFEDVCPNCGGNFTQRPIRPKKLHGKYPITEKRTFDPKDLEKARALTKKYKSMDPKDR